MKNDKSHKDQRILKYLERRGVIESRHELTLQDDDSAYRETEHSLHSMRLRFPTLGNVGNVMWTEGAAAR